MKKVPNRGATSIIPPSGATQIPAKSPLAVSTVVLAPVPILVLLPPISPGAVFDELRVP